MKKQIAFYVGWDVVFIFVLYANFTIGLWAKEYIERTTNILALIWTQPILPILIGFVIAWLIFITNQYDFTKKLAILELIIIGIPTFYIATGPIIYYAIPHIPMFRGFYPDVPFWIANGGNINFLSAILLGYEILIFILRIIKIKKMKNPSESER